MTVLLSLPWVPLACLLTATVYDLRSRIIPDWIAGVLVAWAVLATALHLHEVGWLSMLGGFGGAFVVALVLFCLDGLGGGDVKLISALGASLGHEALLGLLFWSAVAGGVLSLGAFWRGKRDLAYVPAIALGLILFITWCEGISHLRAPADVPVKHLRSRASAAVLDNACSQSTPLTPKAGSS